MQQSASLNGCYQNLLSPWLPPGGSCHDEISASRNRYFVVTDEGWRWLKVLDFPVEWRKQEHMPLIRLHSFTNLSPPLISLFCQSVPKCRLPKNPASPRGKPRGSCGSWFHSTFCTVPSANGRLRRWRVAKLATPTGCGENHWLAANQRGTLPQPRYAQQLPQRGSQGCFAPGTAGGYEPPLPVQWKPRRLRRWRCKTIRLQ